MAGRTRMCLAATVVLVVAAATLVQGKLDTKGE